MVAIVRVPVTDFSPERLDTGFYSQEYYAARVQIIKSGLSLEPIGSVCEPWQFGAYALCNDIVWSNADEGIPFLKAEAIESPLVNESALSYVTKATHSLLAKSSLKAGDIIMSTSGTVGRLAVLPDAIPVANSNQDTIKFSLTRTTYDSHFVAAWLTSKYAQAFMSREAGGAVQQHIYLYNFKRLPLLKLTPATQKYIGDKVRQAERLRAWVKALGAEVESLVSNETVKTACATPEKKHNRPQLDDLTHRLDPKYYGNRAVAVFRRAKAIGKPLASLITGIANGFEERVFFDTGRDYITVTEVSSGRLELSSAPKISHATEVPDKAIIHERCVLVVRTGSIGTAVKVDARDRGAVISSHLIRLEFADEADAAAVAAYLCSTAGKVLQHKISYGAVQPQIGQDELLALPVPQFVLDVKEQILALITEKESAIRVSKALTTMAKFLVEALIEGQLTEADLIAAERALQARNDQLDRQILNRLKTDGVDGQDQALFSDLDQLYSLLQQASHS